MKIWLNPLIVPWESTTLPADLDEAVGVEAGVALVVELDKTDMGTSIASITTSGGKREVNFFIV